MLSAINCCVCLFSAFILVCKYKAHIIFQSFVENIYSFTTVLRTDLNTGTPI